MAKVIITGGSGFIGTNLMEALISKGFEVKNLDIRPPRNSDHFAHWVKLDLLNARELCAFFKKFSPDFVFHLAARTDLCGQNLDDYLVNTDGVANVISAIKCVSSIRSVIFASSMLVCKLGYIPSTDCDYFPDTVYGESKVIGEQLVRSGSVTVPWMIIRPTSIWGPWFSVPYRNFFDAVRRGFYIHPKNLQVRRSYGFVLNSVQQLINLSQSTAVSRRNGMVYLADYEPVDLKTWAEAISQASNSGRIREFPRMFFKAAGRVGDLLKVLGVENPPMTTFRFNNMVTEAVFDTSTLELYCSELPYSMQEGVSLTCEWLDAQEVKS